MPDHILYTYKGAKQRDLTEEEIASGINPSLPPHHPGVPLRDLTADDIEALPPWLQDTVAASDLYEVTAEGKRRHNAAVKAREVEQGPEPSAAVTPPRHASKPEKE